MVDKLFVEGVVDCEEFIKLVNDLFFFDVDIIKDILVDEEFCYVLEGYLFFEIYEFKKGSFIYDVMQ